MQPEPWKPPPPEFRELSAWVDRPQALNDMHRQEANRLEAAFKQPGMVALIEGHMPWLKDSIKALELQINDHIDRHPRLREDVSLITSIPDLGNTTAAKVLAAFVGVTPKIKESGSSV